VHLDRFPIGPAGPNSPFDQLVEKEMVIDVTGELLKHAQLPVSTVNIDDREYVGADE